MKKNYLLVALLFVTTISFGQTNIFPADGSVGIGTTSPELSLHININSDSKPEGIVTAPIAGIKLSRIGTPNYSYAEAAEFRIGHGGPTYWGSKLDLYINGANNQTNIPDQQVMTWLYNGNVGIGTIDPTEKLSVNGKIRSKEIKVELAGWSDFVFAKDYKLPTLQETEKHIQDNGRLAGIPSAAEVKANGIDLGEMNAKLLQKIEELTLYLIKLNKQFTNQEVINSRLNDCLGLLEKENKILKDQK